MSGMARRKRPANRPAEELRRLWTLDVADLKLVDLRDEAVREAFGLDVTHLVGQRELAQRMAQRAQAAGAQGIVMPSAAHSGHWTLVVFPAGFPAVRVVESREMHPKPPG